MVILMIEPPTSLADQAQYYKMDVSQVTDNDLQAIVNGQSNQGLRCDRGFVSIILTTAGSDSVSLYVLRHNDTIDAGSIVDTSVERVGLDDPFNQWGQDCQVTGARRLAVDRMTPIIPAAAADTQTRQDKTRLQFATEALASPDVHRILGLNIYTYEGSLDSSATPPHRRPQPPDGFHRLNYKLFHTLTHKRWDHHVDETNKVYVLSPIELIDQRKDSASTSILPTFGELEPLAPTVQPIPADPQTATYQLRNGVVFPKPSLRAAIDPRDPRTGRATIAVADDQIREFISLGKRANMDSPTNTTGKYDRGHGKNNRRYSP